MTQKPDFSVLPDILRTHVEAQWRDYVAFNEEPPAEFILDQLPSVWAASPFVARCCASQPAILRGEAALCLQQVQPAGAILRRVMDAAHRAEDEATLKRNLRTLRQSEMARIAWRDLAGSASLEETLRDLSSFADACLECTLRWLEADMQVKHGIPRDEQGEPVHPVVLAMGKLGGEELNFSSDIDLIFAFRAHGETDGERSIENEAYFRKLTQRLIRILEERTADGFVFRVDTRLRPFGEHGALVLQFAALEDYYQHHGRDWERYALIKARPAAGDIQGGETLLRALRPFIYRRYIDFTTFESLRDMKSLVQQQVARKGLGNHIKLGSGGIREVEFIAQAFQLIRGGQVAEFRQRNLLATLHALEAQGQLPTRVVNRLKEAYTFLRRLENRLQAYADEQTHELPTEDSAQASIAIAMGYSTWPELAHDLATHRRRVEEDFQQVFAAPQANDEPHDDYEQAVKTLWEEETGSDNALALLESMGLDQAEAVLQALRSLKESALYRSLGERGRTRLNRLMPLLFGAAETPGETGTVLVRMLRVVEAVAGRGTYIALLLENPTALSQLARLCTASPWITDYIAHHPILLDELLDPRTLYAPPGAEVLTAELADHGEVTQGMDFEAEMDYLRWFKQSHTLRVAAADITANMPLMVVSDHLTDIAEVVLRHALELAWVRTTERYGQPVRADGSLAAFAVIAYGKLGGIELGYGSDLDLVFLHDGAMEDYTDGDKALEHPVFFVRLGQRLIHILSTRTPAGQAYEVDMRLRPSGKSGLLVSPFEGYATYQRESAWIWEHQALVRARGLAGNEQLNQRFQDLRAEILCQSRDAETLRTEVLQMRSRMRADLEQAEPGRFDLKQGRGGMTDIEFIVQYAVLRWAGEYPALLDYTDNIRLLEALARESLLRDDEASDLADAYRAYRARAHRLYLRGEPAMAARDEYAQHSRKVVQIWSRLLEPPG